jgi:enamine deaminase RidA (YjgF/YER057c/UK114 family)
MKKEIIDVPGISKHLKKDRRYFRRNPPARVFCTVGSWPKKFDVEIDCIAVV